MAAGLNVIQKVEGKYCENCTYQPTGVRRVLPDGSGSNGVCLVGDSPWTDEVATGRPFAGASGKFLDTILTKRGLQREDFLITNSLWCKPPKLGMNDEPEKYAEAELAAKQCRPYLDELITERRPKVLVALGNVALRRLTGFDGIEANHSYIIQTDYGIPCVPTFHPSGILQGNHKLTIAFILAIARALECSKDNFQGTKCNIIEDPNPAYIQYPGNEPALPGPLMCDIETPNSVKNALNEEEAEDDPSYQIIRMGFSVNAWSGVSFPFEGDYIRRAKELVRRAKQLIFWNKNYDLPRLRAAGFDLHPDVVIIDAMWAWHWLYSDLPKALAFAAPFFYAGAPWKHLSSQRPAFYNAMDNAIQMGVYQGAKAHLEAEGRWERFWNHCVRVDPIYVRIGDKGVKVDKGVRTEFMKALEDDAVRELVKVQELLPAKLLDVEILQRKPKLFELDKVAEDKLAKEPLKYRFKELIKVEELEVEAVRKDGTKVPTPNGNLKKAVWRRTTPFNPNSHDQLIELLLELGIKPPKARGEDRESVEAKYLKRLGKKHPIFNHCVNFKQRSKLVSTYNWPLDAEDRAHTTYAFHPSTWRSSSRDVNLGNIPKRYELAKLFRALLIAEKGCKLIEIDRSAIEAVLVGYWAKSPEYIKLAKAGVHSFLVSHVLNRPVPWEVIRDTPLKEVQGILKEFKKEAGVEIYEGCKRCIHGSNYLLTPYGMHDEYEEFFPTLASAQRVQDIYFGSPAGETVRRWHKATLEEAHRTKFLDNSFQYRHHFFGPLFKFNKRDKKWEVEHDGDAKRAIAFRPQSDAAAIQREDLLALEPIDWFSGLLRLPTYDSLIAECPVGRVDEAIDVFVKQFKKPIPELNGLTIGFEIKIGENLRDMTEVMTWTEG